MIAWAKKHGMVTLVHTGGSSIPGSSGIWADHLLAIKPHVSFHVNGGPVAMPDGSVILVEIARQTLTRVMPDGKCHVIANLGGGPNGAAMGPGGKIYVTNKKRAAESVGIATRDYVYPAGLTQHELLTLLRDLMKLTYCL